MQIRRRLAIAQNYDAAANVRKQELLQEQEMLEARYERGFQWASKFSEGALDAYMADEGTRRICARIVEISEELLSLES